MIEREEHEGTVTLIVQPLAGGELRSLMRIRAEISPPDASRRTPKIEIFFHGSAHAGKGGRISVSDARTWLAALEALIAEAEKAADEMQSLNRPTRQTENSANSNHTHKPSNEKEFRKRSRGGRGRPRSGEVGREGSVEARPSDA